MDVKQSEVVLCEFYFSDLKQNKLRPVVVFKDNLPFDDFVGMPMSSKLDRLNNDEILVDESDFVEGFLPKRSKVMIRKTFVISKQVVVKKYGTLSSQSFRKLHLAFCRYFGCEQLT
jgi:mRNA interferase MazF